MVPVPESLAAILRTQRAEALISQAKLIRDYPESPERTREAERHVREALVQRALGNVTAQEEYRIFSLLSFVMPSDAAEDEERAPIAQRLP